MAGEDTPVTVVTGGNRGIGFEVCGRLAERGHHVLLGARDETKGRAAADRLSGRGEVEAVRLDVTADGDGERLAAHLQERHGRLDVLVNNAAINYDTWQRAAAVDMGVVRETAEANLFGPWRLTVALLPLLRSSPHPRIVNVSSGAGGLTGMTGGTPAYSVTKAGLNAVTLMLADELRSDGILVNSVCPGWVATDMGGTGGRPVGDGAAGVVWAATLPDDGPSGGFFRDGEPVPW